MEWKKGEYVRMVANKNYWKGAPKVDEVIFQTYQNSDTMAQDLKTGALQTGLEHPRRAVRAARQGARASRPSPDAADPASTSSASTAPTRRSTPSPRATRSCRTPAFRRALQWAVDKDKIVAVAYGGHARAAEHHHPARVLPQETDYHWQPPEGDPDTYTFDLERAKQELDAAGYTDSDGNGIREYKGKDIELRLYARTESVESQSAASSSRAGSRTSASKSTTQVIDDGRLGDLQFAFDGDKYAPDFDLFIWGWGGDIDPNFILSIMTTSSIEVLERLRLVQQGVRRPLPASSRRQVDMQQRIDDRASACSRSSTTSPRTSCWCTRSSSRPTTTAQWQGWVPQNGKGQVWYNTLPDTYMNDPEDAAAGRLDSGHPNTTLIIVGVVIAVVVVIVIVLVLVRRGRRQVEEA